jgi:hypothetical protein
MPKIQKLSTPEVTPKAEPGFQIGHARYGGRKKRTAQAARDLADSLGCDPLAFMMGLIQKDTYMQTVIEPDGKKKKIEVAVTMDLRLDAARTVVNYLYPRLNAQAISGPDNGPIELEAVTVNLDAIRADPEMCAAAQALSLGLSAAGANGIPAQPQIAPPGESAAQPARDPMETLERDPITGHWRK